MNNEVAVTRKDYVELHRSTQGTEKMQVMEWITIAHIDPTQLSNSQGGLIHVNLEKETLLRWGLCREDNFSRDIVRLHNEMTNLKITLEEGTKLHNFVIFPGVQYNRDTGEVIIEIHGKFAPYLTHLKSNFRQFKLPILLDHLQGFWSRKLYVILRNELYHSSECYEFEIHIDELKKRLGLSGHYDKWPDFAKKVINPSIKEINSVDTDIHVQIISKKRRHKGGVWKITFLIEEKSEISQMLPMAINEPSTIRETVRAYADEVGFDQSQFKFLEGLAAEHGGLVLEKAVILYRRKLKFDKFKPYSPAGYFRTKIGAFIQPALKEMEAELNKKEKEIQRQNTIAKWKRNNSFEVWSKNYLDIDLPKIRAEVEKLGLSMPIPSSETLKEQWLQEAEKQK